MADNNEKAYKAALKQVDDMLKKQEALKKSTKSIADSWNAVASEIFKMDGAQFFANVQKSSEELEQMGKEVEKLQSQFEGLGQKFEDLILKNIGGLNGLQSTLVSIGNEHKNLSKLIDSNNRKALTIQSTLSDDLKERLKTEGSIEKILLNQANISDDELKKLKEIKKFNDETKKYHLDELDYHKKIQKQLSELIQDKAEIATIDDKVATEMLRQIAEGKQIGELIKKANAEEMRFLSLLSENTEETKKISKGMADISAMQDDIRKKARETNKEFSISKTLVGALGSAASGFASIVKRDWVSSMMKFDEVLNNVQKQTSINMDDNKTAFAELQMEVAQFGVSVEQAGQMMADMSKELNTTNFGVLASAAKDFAAIEGATGAASGDITHIAGELMRMGESSGQVKDFMQGADQEARRFGVNSSKVLGAISRNIGKIRSMGFVGGEKSLAKMVATAERLRMNVDEIFDVAKRARSIEGAMDMAAELQLAGGSFANINPMDLLAAARKGPAELQKILTTMGKDIGHFSQETGKYEFDPVDVDRLQMVADATGQSLDSIQNMIQKNAEDTEKLNPFQGMIDGLDEADKEIAKSALSDMITRNKDGTLTINAESDMAKKMGVDDLKDINSDTIQAMLKQKMEDGKNLEEQNKRNQSLKQSFDNFINSLMSLFSFFQPALEFLTKVMQEVTSVFTWIGGFLPGWSKALLGGLIIFGAMFSTNVGLMVGKFLTGFAGGVKNLIGAIANPKKAIGGLLGKLGGDGAAPETPTMPGKDLANGPEAIGKSGSKIDMGGVLKFAAAMALIGVAVAAFGFGIKQMGGIGALEVLEKGAISIGLLALAVLGISYATKGLDLGGIIKFSAAMVLVGVALIPFAFAAQMLTDVDWMSVLAGIGILTLVVFGLMALGALMMGPQILFLLAGVGILIAVGASLLIASAGLLLAANAFNQLSAIDWSGFSNMGDALLSVVPGLMGFSLAAMMFMNPITLLGIVFMVGALSSLASVMMPLSESLTVGADSLDRFASGLEKLSEAADALSLEKLEKLKALSDSMADASAGGAMMSAMANMAKGASAGTGGGAGDVRKIEVDVKLNGRELQNFIVKDTAIIK